MALHGVFANDLQFGQGINSDQAQDDEREPTELDDADLEEGEIADDDEDAQQDDTKQPVDKLDTKSIPKCEAKKDDLKNIALPQSERSECSGLKSGGGNAEKRKDKRIGASSRTRKREGEDVSSHRDSNRKRRRTHEGGKDIEDVDYDVLNARGHSPMDQLPRYGGGGESTGSDYEESNANTMRRKRVNEGRSRLGRSSPPRRRPASGNKDRRSDQRRQERDRLERDRRSTKNNPSGSNASSNKIKDESICAFYMEGKCSRGNDCPYSHAALPPRKMELCKFYLMDCCAKKDKCLYLHKDFPCKFFHTGKKCRHSAEECKFSHDSLSETMRAILIKHIETAPREILGDFPRLTREETIQAIDNFSPLMSGREKRPQIPSLFESGSATVVPINKMDTKDAERHVSIADRKDETIQSSARRIAGFYQDIPVASESEPVGREQLEENSRSIWFGQLRQEMGNEIRSLHNQVSENPSEKVEEPSASPLARIKTESHNAVDYISKLPARQRQLYRRIQQQQREPTSVNEGLDPTDEKNSLNDKWYSSDEEENSESMSDLLKSIKQKPDVVEKSVSAPELTGFNLSSFENINVAEIAKALSSLQQQNNSFSYDGGASSTTDSSRRDPRTRDPRVRGPAATLGMGDVDLRVSNPPRQDVDLRLGNRVAADVDLRSGLVSGNIDETGSSDIDLRRFPLNFKTTAVHAPVHEIEASVNSRPPMEYQVWLVDYIPLDYSVIRVQADWAHLDPRQQKAHGGIRDFTNTDPPAIPLGPASPDPICTTSTTLRQYEPEPAAYSPMRSGPNDPRARGLRRTSAVSAQSAGVLPEKRGVSGIGLLGAAPPGMLPLLSKGNSSPQETSYTNFRPANNLYVDRNQIDESSREQPRQIENRRDPRQRHRNTPVSTDSIEQSYTLPGENERVFR